LNVEKWAGWISYYLFSINYKSIVFNTQQSRIPHKTIKNASKLELKTKRQRDTHFPFFKTEHLVTQGGIYNTPNSGFEL